MIWLFLVDAFRIVMSKASCEVPSNHLSYLSDSQTCNFTGGRKSGILAPLLKLMKPAISWHLTDEGTAASCSMGHSP